MKSTPLVESVPITGPLDATPIERSTIAAVLERATERRQRLDAVLRDLDLNPARYLLRVRYGWQLHDILLAEDEFLDFLAAILRNPTRPLSPSQRADQFWHAVLMISQLDAQICDHVFDGKRLLHNPFHTFSRDPGRG
jgi:hypothetical protein